MSSIKKIIRIFFLENLIFTDDESALLDNESLLDKRIIDSTGLIEITLFLEETFNIKINDAEMLPENFDSVEKLVAFIGHKQSISA